MVVKLWCGRVEDDDDDDDDVDEEDDNEEGAKQGVRPAGERHEARGQVREDGYRVIEGVEEDGRVKQGDKGKQGH